jgi:hypothetical protein
VGVLVGDNLQMVGVFNIDEEVVPTNVNVDMHTVEVI